MMSVEETLRTLNELNNTIIEEMDIVTWGGNKHKGKKDKRVSGILYLRDEKNIITLGNRLVDLNTVSDIRVCRETKKIFLNQLNGKIITHRMGEPYYNFDNVPNIHKDVNYFDVDVKRIKSEGLSSEFDFFVFIKLHVNTGEKVYKMYNKAKTDSLSRLRLLEWEKQVSYIISKWSGVEFENMSKVINPETQALLKEFYETNKDDSILIDNMDKIFGFGYHDILEWLDIGDFYIDGKGKIVKLNENE